MIVFVVLFIGDLGFVTLLKRTSKMESKEIELNSNTRVSYYVYEEL